MRSLPYLLEVGHIDHQLRRNSAADARFVKRLAGQWALPCTIQKVHVARQRKRFGQGIEEAARELRYRALARIARRKRCRAILTAHNADDQAETVLMNFLRGAGPAGLAGIPPVRPLTADSPIVLIRPWLGVRRADILRYVKANRLRYRRDPSNASLHFWRNRIRHKTLPFLEKEQLGLSSRLIQLASIGREEEEFWGSLLQKELPKTSRKKGKEITIDLTHLLGYHSALSRRILRHLLPGQSFQVIERILSLARSPLVDRRLNLPGGWRVQKKSNQMRVVRA